MLRLTMVLIVLTVSQSVFAQDMKDALATADFTGGLVVHLGSQDGGAEAALGSAASSIVQGLALDASVVQRVREHLGKAGQLGRVSARTFDGVHLPYATGTVNLLVVTKAFSVTRAEMLRVLCPNGTLCTAANGKWKTETKPRPAAMDNWTHYLHDPQGTMVGNDTLVGLPKRLQWVGGPKWLRNHEFMSSMHAMVANGGRIFYIMDEGRRSHAFLPSKWVLIARDAFNGTVLWRRPLPNWHPQNWPMKSGPGHLPRRLVAVGDRVYVTLGIDAPLSALDAVTGKTVRTYAETKTTQEIAVADGVLYLLTDPSFKPLKYRETNKFWLKARSHANTTWGWTAERSKRTVMAVQSDTGKVLWKHATSIAPLTLTVGPKNVLWFDGSEIVALNRGTGKQAWRSDGVKVKVSPATGSTPRMVISQGVALLVNSGDAKAVDAATGKVLWAEKLMGTGHNSPNDVFVIKGLVWSGGTGKSQMKGTGYKALDLRTGEVKHEYTAKNPKVYFMHQRCYPGKATQKYLLTSGTGTEFHEPGTDICHIHHYIRGSCIYGIMPCNGLLYKPPDSCACHYQSKITDFCALASAEEPEPAVKESDRLQKGPAYGKVTPTDATGWTTYRSDAARSGRSKSTVPAKLKQAWATRLKGKLTAVSVGYDKVFVAEVDRHTLYALDAKTGKVSWNFLAGGRVDSPPTLYKGQAIFGSADGWVYSLRASDGALVWRRLIAPGTRQIVSYQRLESLWPLHGSVLLYDNVLYCLSGRNMFVDGGMHLVRVDPVTGRQLSANHLNEIDPTTGKNLQLKMPGKAMPVANADLLSCDGKYVYMGAQKVALTGKRVDIDAPKYKESAQVGEGRHLFCPTGFLDAAWFHRSYMMYGLTGGEGHGEYAAPPKLTPTGRLLVCDENRVYGFRATVYGNVMLPRPAHFLFAAQRNAQPVATPAPDPEPKKKKRDKKKGKKPREKNPKSGEKGGLRYLWQTADAGLLPNAMVLADRTLLMAGPPDVADETKMFGFLPGADDEHNRSLREQDKAWAGKQGALLYAVNADTGEKTAQYKLPAIPVWDGMAADNGKLYISLQNNTVVCWE